MKWNNEEGIKITVCRIILLKKKYDNYLNEASKLDGENYIEWKFKILTIFEAWNVWTVVNGDETKPIGVTCTKW